MLGRRVPFSAIAGGESARHGTRRRPSATRCTPLPRIDALGPSDPVRRGSSSGSCSLRDLVETSLPRLPPDPPDASSPTLPDASVAGSLPHCTPSVAGELKLFPADIPLTGPRAAQQLLLGRGRSRGRRRRPHGRGQVRVADPKVATVDETGLVRPVGDGETTITATADGKSATREGAGDEGQGPDAAELPQPRHADPDAGRLQLRGVPRGPGRQGRAEAQSLRGYDPDADHFVLTRQALRAGASIAPSRPRA